MRKKMRNMGDKVKKGMHVIPMEVDDRVTGF